MEVILLAVIVAIMLDARLEKCRWYRHLKSPGQWCWIRKFR